MTLLPISRRPIAGRDCLPFAHVSAVFSITVPTLSGVVVDSSTRIQPDDDVPRTMLLRRLRRAEELETLRGRRDLRLCRCWAGATRYWREKACNQRYQKNYSTHKFSPHFLIRASWNGYGCFAVFQVVAASTEGSYASNANATRSPSSSCWPSIPALAGWLL